MIGRLLGKVRDCGCILSKEGDKLKLEYPERLPEQLKNQLRQHKDELLQVFRYEEEAAKQQWVILPDGEGFEKHISRLSCIYIFREADGSYTTWRGTWAAEGGSKPGSEKVLAESVPFEEAMKRANSYIDWYKNRGRNNRKGGR